MLNEMMTHSKWGVSTSNSAFSKAKEAVQRLGTNALKLSWTLKKSLSKRGSSILIASMPKSGSTFLVNSLSELTGFPYVSLAKGYERNDQNLYLPYLIDSYNISTVTHQHVAG